MTIEFDPEAGVRFHIVEGEVTVEMVRRWLGETYAHPEFNPDHHAIWDLREASGTISHGEIRALAAAVSESFPGRQRVRVALVVQRDLHYGLSRTYEQLLDEEGPVEIGVFRETAKALLWLGA
jgi:hypothetical protein